jgi:hypothetical protein
MSSSNHTGDPVYSKNTLEFVAVAKSYCDFLEEIGSLDKDKFIETMVRLLPLLYLKGTLLPETELIGEGAGEPFATEAQYGILAETMAGLLGDDDAYLSVYHPDITLSDGHVAAFISENIADIWQEMYNFVEAFRLGYDETMNDALYLCRENFGSGWGQSLLNALCALHAVKFNETEDDFLEDKTAY